VGTTASVSPAQADTTRSWTTYSVSVRIGKDAHAPARTDVARLTPLPSPTQPDVMFMGVTSSGRQAVFTLGAAVGHTGPGLCRPNHKRCAAIMLAAGQTEHLTVPGSGGTSRPLVLRVVRISRSVTHTFKTALDAYERHSAVGLCELALADPVSYDLLDGTVSTVAAKLCKGYKAAVPFEFAASLVSASSPTTSASDSGASSAAASSSSSATTTTPAGS
jgi:hypothetical protein